MKTVTIIAMCLMLGLNAHAQLDTNLMRNITSWRKGDAPPPRLLKFPDGKVDTIPSCGMRSLGSEVSDYIGEIQNADLLAALLFDYRAEPDTFRATTSRLIRLKGVGYLSQLLTERRKTEPGGFQKSEIAVLGQLLRSPYLAVQIARIASADMGTGKAESALLAMKIDLQAGMPWDGAYRKHSDLHPNVRERTKDPRSVRTLISYLHDTSVSPSGFDIVDYRTAENLPAAHLRELFRAKRGTYILRGTDGVYLYHILDHYEVAD